jgi:hypothetical protein
LKIRVGSAGNSDLAAAFGKTSETGKIFQKHHPRIIALVQAIDHTQGAAMLAGQEGIFEKTHQICLCPATIERHPLVLEPHRVVEVLSVVKDLGQERVQHCHYGIAPIIMSLESEIYKDFVFLFNGTVRIKTLEDVFRSIGGASSPMNVKYVRPITVKPFRVRFVQADPIEPMLRTMQ